VEVLFWVDGIVFGLFIVCCCVIGCGMFLFCRGILVFGRGICAVRVCVFVLEATRVVDAGGTVGSDDGLCAVAHNPPPPPVQPTSTAA